MTNEWHLFYGHIVDESSKVGHHWLIEVGVILTFILIDQVEIPHKKPWPMTLPSDVSELLEESYLLLGTLQLINTCEPPWLLAARAELNRDRKIVNPCCSRRSQSLSPSHKYPSTSPNRGREMKFVSKSEPNMDNIRRRGMTDILVSCKQTTSVFEESTNSLTECW
jgi:hypothetical protein